MKIAYLLADTALSGGIRVILAHADALTARGHDVVLVTTDAPPYWRETLGTWQRVQDLGAAAIGDCDFVVGTFWTTVRIASELAPGRAVHLCQGYEGAFTAYAAIKHDIDAVYALPIPKLVVSAPLIDVLRPFSDDVTWVGQIVDDAFFQPHPRQFHGRARVLVSGQAQADMKGIDVAYDAVRYARRRGADLDLIRVSPWPSADGEPVDLAAEFHVAIDTARMAQLIASSDIFLGTSRREEGFGLPAAEALASGVPSVLSEIPSFLSWDARQDFASFAAEGDAAATGDALLRLLRDGVLREQRAARGREVAEQFRSERTGERLERYFSARLPRRTSGR